MSEIPLIESRTRNCGSSWSSLTRFAFIPGVPAVETATLAGVALGLTQWEALRRAVVDAGAGRLVHR